ncbi:hypothetical protein SNEBB_011472 [Seison nebaliae]|nr:hypothetical protein SNEBB_011472 [Seison nebaliae]
MTFFSQISEWLWSRNFFSSTMQRRHQTMIFGTKLPQMYKTIRLTHRSVKPSRRSGHRMVATATDLWLWGGYDNRTFPQVFAELWRYNILTRVWYQQKTTGDIPVDLCASPAICLVGSDYLMLYSGTSEVFSENLRSEVYQLSLTTFQWKKRKFTSVVSDEIDQPPRVYGGTIFYYNQKIYIIGGIDGHQQYYSKLFEIDLDADTIQCRATFMKTTGFYRAEPAIWKDKLYLFGGSTHQRQVRSLNEIPVMNLMTFEEDLIKLPEGMDIPRSRKFHSHGQHKNFVFVFGGIVEESLDRYEEIDKYLWRFDCDTSSWRRIELICENLIPTWFAASACYDGTFYQHGGVHYVAGAGYRHREFFLINLSLKSLRFICFSRYLMEERIDDGNENAIEEKYRKLGIPSEYTRQLMIAVRARRLPL